MDIGIVGITIFGGLLAVKWLVYTALLWIMIKLQKLQYNGLGLLGSSALATVLNVIPIVGPYLSYAALVICLWKVTRADIVPDVVFTILVAGGLMFVLNLWAFAALMGQLRPDLQMSAEETSLAMDDPTDDDTDISPPASAATTAPVREVAVKLPDPKPGQATSAVPRIAALGDPPKVSNPTYGLVLKGVMLNSRQASAMLQSGGKLYTIEQGSVLSIPAAGGALKLRCNSIDNSSVSLTVNDNQEIVLRLY